MKYTAEEELNEIMRRSRKVSLRKERRKVQIQTCLTGAFSLLVIAVLILLPKGTMMTTKQSVYGAFLLSGESGGYVLVALISFVLGCMVAFLCMKYKRLREQEEKEENEVKQEKK